ncbi:response regulator [bacterium]|nr:response regulator [bacterium]
MKEAPRVLVLEDDLNMLETLCGVLRFHSYDPRAADNPQTAMELAKIMQFQLILSDIRMGGPTDGLGAMQKIKKFQPKAKIVMITGYADEDAARRAVEILVDDYVHKPIKLPVLMEVVDRVLNPPPRQFSPLAGLRGLLAGPMKLMEQAKAQKVQRMLGLLEVEKQKVLQAFYVSLRARGLSKSASLELWDQLEKLEAGWLKLPGTPTEEALQAMGVAYRKVYERMAHYQKTGNVASMPPREGNAVSRNGFQSMVDYVQAGKVAQEELLLLLEARLKPDKAAALPPGLQDVFRQLMA